MKKLTLLFPGQGSQYVGMGKGFESQLDQANETLGYDLKKLMLEGPLEELTLTQNAQPAIVSHSLAMFEKLKETVKGKAIIERCLGHSVGEYAALAASGVMSFQDAIHLVHQRGKFMQEAVPAGIGAMMAIMRVPSEKVVQACELASQPDSQVMCANFNDPGQIVISGHKDACDRAVEELKKDDSLKFRAIALKVSAPFHSSLMLPAQTKMAEVLDKVDFKSCQKAYIANINAREYLEGTAGTIIKDNLIAQISGSVMWLQSIENLSSNTICLEVGPGKVLKGLVKKIKPEIQVISLDQEGSESELEEILS